MTLEQFRQTLADAAPPAPSDLALSGLWWAAKGDWDRAHGCVQQQEGEPACDLVHAFLHRQEGDLANAAYWYRRAGRTMPNSPEDEEWDSIATQMLARPQQPAAHGG